MNTLDAALEYLDRGWLPIPITQDTKQPTEKWGVYVDEKRLPTEEEVISWWKRITRC